MCQCCDHSRAFLFGFDLLQIRRTAIKAPMSLNFVKISSRIKELAALEHLKKLMDNVALL